MTTQEKELWQRAKNYRECFGDLASLVLLIEIRDLLKEEKPDTEQCFIDVQPDDLNAL